MPPLPRSMVGSRENWALGRAGLCHEGLCVASGLVNSPPLGDGCPALLKSWGSEFIIGELGGPWPGEGATAHPPTTACLSPTGAEPLRDNPGRAEMFSQLIFPRRANGLLALKAASGRLWTASCPGWSLCGPAIAGLEQGNTTQSTAVFLCSRSWRARQLSCRRPGHLPPAQHLWPLASALQPRPSWAGSQRGWGGGFFWPRCS